jgi:hypothetical protein
MQPRKSSEKSEFHGQGSRFRWSVLRIPGPERRNGFRLLVQERKTSQQIATIFVDSYISEGIIMGLEMI